MGAAPRALDVGGRDDPGWVVWCSGPGEPGGLDLKRSADVPSGLAGLGRRRRLPRGTVGRGARCLRRTGTRDLRNRSGAIGVVAWGPPIRKWREVLASRKGNVKQTKHGFKRLILAVISSCVAPCCVSQGRLFLDVYPRSLLCEAPLGVRDFHLLEEKGNMHHFIFVIALILKCFHASW